MLEDGRGGLLFSNPSSLKRENLTVKASADGGATWSIVQVVHEGPAAYSDLAIAGDGTILCLFECGEERPYEMIAVARFGRD
ncbi:sialidase family protein [Gordoniibacillus kamchatkensis]|uniref:sialidase family protein n=1 Tax=Gordoniibacillus kamchatkensis TaxID=1590651 RepID=UPI0006981BB3|nr:sialidase family protein [Paenibacillus sp. VKM B-2647]